MAAALLRRRVSALGVSPFLKDNVESFWLWLELKGGCETEEFKTKRYYGSSSSTRKFDFTDLKDGSCSISNKLDLTDLTRPHTWYPVARKKRRKVILHVGPTNSGKTHSALKQLELSLSGKLFHMFWSTMIRGKIAYCPPMYRKAGFQSTYLS
ncbi:hypothetical protein BT93_B0787 [Corymbia citriodora subsp. variegata]|nr:hypothetical protein BT93_B0787 [Corymbia citriodora subsp. variegata]